MSADRILSLMKNCDSKNPMSLRVLSKKTGMDIGELHPVIQEMYDTRGINRCVVTKDGITDLMFWPTGVVSKLDFKNLLRNYTTKKTELQEKPVVKNEKSKGRIMLEIIANKGTASSKELLAASGASAVKPFIQGYFDRGLLESSGAWNNKTYALAPGVTPEQLLSGGKRESVTKAAPAKRSEPQHVVHSVAAPDQIGVASELAVDERPTKMRFERAPFTRRFRLARTSDATLMLFGLGDEPIELDADQTNLLVKFVTEGALSHG